MAKGSLFGFWPVSSFNLIVLALSKFWCDFQYPNLLTPPLEYGVELGSLLLSFSETKVQRRDANRREKAPKLHLDIYIPAYAHERPMARCTNTELMLRECNNASFPLLPL